MTALPIGEKTFTENDQRFFASVSLDSNPMHMDAIAARRLVAGRQVVHGIHVLLTALEYWRSDDEGRVESMSCVFGSPVGVGDKVTFAQRRDGERGYAIEASVEGLVCSKVIITTADNDRSPGGSRSEPVLFENGVEFRVPATLQHPLDDAPEAHLDRIYVVPLNEANFSVNFPRCYLHLGESGFAAVAALSRFVGMVCPGLHSIFSSLSLEPADVSVAADVLSFRVRTYDPRSHLFDIAFQGRLRGSLRAFLRPPPQAQPSLKELSAHVAPEEFRGTRALIIGGSRGLGEFTAKVLAAGGGDVVITYASGLDDARRIRDEINSGGSRCELRELDLAKDTFDAAMVDVGPLDAVFFFATPRIYRKKAEVFEPRLFNEFCQMYIKRLYELCVNLEQRAGAGSIKVFFPSTIFVSQRPKGMAEYAMAKAAAEVLIEDINRSFKRVAVLCTRLPRLNTDQTTSVLRMPTESNLDTLLPVIRSVMRKVDGTLEADG